MRIRRFQRLCHDTDALLNERPVEVRATTVNDYLACSADPLTPLIIRFEFLVTQPDPAFGPRPVAILEVAFDLFHQTTKFDNIALFHHLGELALGVGFPEGIARKFSDATVGIFAPGVKSVSALKSNDEFWEEMEKRLNSTLNHTLRGRLETMEFSEFAQAGAAGTRCSIIESTVEGWFGRPFRDRTVLRLTHAKLPEVICERTLPDNMMSLVPQERGEVAATDKMEAARWACGSLLNLRGRRRVIMGRAERERWRAVLWTGIAGKSERELHFDNVTAENKLPVVLVSGQAKSAGRTVWHAIGRAGKFGIIHFGSTLIVKGTEEAWNHQAEARLLVKLICKSPEAAASLLHDLNSGWVTRVGIGAEVQKMLFWRVVRIHQDGQEKPSFSESASFVGRWAEPEVEANMNKMDPGRKLKKLDFMEGCTFQDDRKSKEVPAEFKKWDKTW